MAVTVLIIALIVASYFIGAVPFGLLVVRHIKGVDIRTVGSGNIGATNVARVAGKKIAILVFVLDFTKGFVPVFGAWLLKPLYGGTDLVPIACGLATVLGHMFPVYLKFRGGKGVATGAGMLCALVPKPLLAAFVVWVAIVAITRYVSLASISASVTLPVSLVAIEGGKAFKEDIWLTVFCIILAALVILRHRSNIKRLLARGESRVGGAGPSEEKQEQHGEES